VGRASKQAWRVGMAGGQSGGRWVASCKAGEMERQALVTSIQRSLCIKLVALPSRPICQQTMHWQAPSCLSTCLPLRAKLTALRKRRWAGSWLPYPDPGAGGCNTRRSPSGPAARTARQCQRLSSAMAVRCRAASSAGKSCWLSSGSRSRASCKGTAGERVGKTQKPGLKNNFS